MILKQLMARALAGHHGTVNLLLLLKWLQQQTEAGFGQVCAACCSFCFPGAVAGERSRGEALQVSVPEWCLAWLLELPRCYLCSRGTKGSAHPSGLEQAQPGAVPALGRGSSPSVPAQPCQEQRAGSSSHPAWPFLTSLPEQRLRVPPRRSLGALQETCSSSPLHSRLLFRLPPPISGVRGNPSPGAGGSGGRNPLAARFPFPAHPGPFPL